jgi:cytoskeleton protein RodZ
MMYYSTSGLKSRVLKAESIQYMNSVGRILRSARERQGRAVAEIADELCLTQQYLRAIEEDDVKNLPGTFFYKNFVRQYAAIVGVKESEIRAGIEALAAAAEEPVLPGNLPQPPVRPMDPIVADSNRHYFANARTGLSVAGLAVVLVACSGFYAWWMRPKEVSAAKPVPQPAVVSVRQDVQSAAQPTGQPTDQPASEPAPAASASPAEKPAAAQDTTVQVAAQVQNQASLDGLNQVVLNLAATEKTWLSITSEGKRLFSGFLEPSQTKTLTGVEAARMTVGNAGGIEVRLNGKPIGPIGKSGQVRVVVFTPDNFEVLPLDLPAATPAETL